MTVARRWAPLAAFLVLAAAWFVANVWGWQQHLHALSQAYAAIGRSVGSVVMMPYDGVPWSLAIASFLPVAGGAGIAFLLRRTYNAPWYLAAVVIPFVVTGGYGTHGLLRAGSGLDAYASGAGVARGSADFTNFGAGPIWVLWAGTALTVAIVVVPAALGLQRVAVARRSITVARVVPYAAIAGLTTFAGLGLLDVSRSGGDQLSVMALAAVGAVTCVIAGAVLGRDPALRHVTVAAAAIAAIAVATLNPGAQPATKLIIAALAVATVTVSAVALRRPRRVRGGSAQLAEA